MTNPAALRKLHPEIDDSIRLADDHQFSNAPDKALQELTRAIDLIGQQRKLDRILQITKGRCYMQMGKINLNQDGIDEAVEAFSHAAGIYETLDFPAELADALHFMGTSESHRANPEVAMSYFRQAAKVREQDGMLAESGLSMLDWSEALCALGEESQSVRKLKEGISRASRLQDRTQYAAALGKAASICREMGMSDDVTTYLEKQVVEQQLLLNKLDSQPSQSAQATGSLSQIQAEWEEKMAALEAEKADELRNFTRKAAHDMKEPLRMIASFGGLLKRQYSETLGEGGNEYVDIVLDANVRMQALLVKLLEYVKVGTIDRPTEPVSMDDVILLASNEVKDKVEASNAVIETGTLPEITAHREYLVQLFTRLLDNALHYNTSSQPIIRINAETRADVHLLIIEDNGIGIEKDNWEKVFELFLRLHGRDEYAGSGIGLATAKKIVALYKGSIHLESVPGKGSKIFVTLPRAQE